MEKTINLNLTNKEYKLLKGCLLTTKETFKCIPIKTNDIKLKIKEIENLIQKINENFEEGS